MSTNPSKPLLKQLLDTLADGHDFKDIELPQQGSWPACAHRLQKKALTHIVAAVGAGRPLLVRGEPGVGKSHLARAAAAVMQHHFISVVVQPQTEYQDLLWSLDYTARLGEAQLMAAEPDRQHARQQLQVQNFITPGPLWYALDFAGDKPPSTYSGYQPEEPHPAFPAANGIVLLIDEIDKADISLCNGLLEVLGNGSFSVSHWPQVVGDRRQSPLVVITSNDSRQLPAAFLRRCVVLNLQLPTDTEELRQHLVDIGQVHFPRIEESIGRQAAQQIIEDRQLGSDLGRTGQAEYLDLLRAIDSMAANTKEQQKWLDQLANCFKKTATEAG